MSTLLIPNWRRQKEQRAGNDLDTRSTGSSVFSANLRMLDVLRGLLAVYVLAGHARWLLWTGHANWTKTEHPIWADLLVYSSATLRFGHEAVFIFFALSGFFIHYRAASRLDGMTEPVSSGNLKKYAWRRAHRLVPPFMAALCITAVLDLIGSSLAPKLYRSGSGVELIDQLFTKKGYSCASVLPAIFLLPSSLGKDFGSNGPLWSIAYEVVYYSLYPAWLLIRTRSAFAAFVILPMASLLAANIIGQLTSSDFADFLASVLNSYGVWIGGAFLCEIVADKSCFRVKIAKLLSIALLSLALGYAAHIKSLELLPIAVCVVTIFAFWPKSLSDNYYVIDVLEFFGIRSFSIYIFHFPMLVVLAAIQFQLLGEQPSSGWLAFGGFVVALGFGCLCFELCERYFLHRSLQQ